MSTTSAIRELPHFAAPRSSQSSDEWYTPDTLVEALGSFDLDPATSLQRGRQLAPRFFTTEQDGLQAEWFGRVWLNPPYSDIRPWVKRMTEHNNGILLCFSRTEAVWFQELIEHCGAVFCLRRRTQFRRPGGNKQACPMGTVLFPFGSDNVRRLKACSVPGLLLRL